MAGTSPASSTAAVVSRAVGARGGLWIALSTVPPINATTKQPTAIRALRRNRGVGHSKPKSGCR
jgi:hypothetical protein